MPNGAVQSPQVLHGIPKDNAVSGVPDVAKAIWGKARQTMHVNIVDIKEHNIQPHILYFNFKQN